MINVNEYFDGQVKSLSVQHETGPATIGVMQAGEYEFGTGTVELMTVTSGALDVLLPNENEWKTFLPFQTFRVEKGVKFKARCSSDCSYLCLYV